MVATFSTVHTTWPHTTAGPRRGKHSGHLQPGSSQYTDAQARYPVGSPWMLVNLALEEHRAGPRTRIWKLRPWSMKARILGAHPWMPWGQTEEGALYRGRPTFPASLVQEDVASSPLPPLDLFRQPKCMPGNESDFRFDKNKNKLGCPSQTEHSRPLPTLPEPPGIAETMTVS